MSIDRDGNWTLSRLGFGRLEVPLNREPASLSVPYRLPRLAHQGPRRWYLIHLHFAIVFARGSGSGLAYVSGLTDSRAAAQVQFHLRSGRHAAAPKIKWESLDLIRGAVGRVTSSRRVEVDFKNYLQLAGVRPGVNTLRVKLERFGPVKVKRLLIFADSGLILTTRTPAHLVVRPALAADEIRAGDSFDVQLDLKNSGDRAARHVGAGVRFRPDGLDAVNRSVFRFGRVPPGGSVHGQMRLKALRPGRYDLRIDASGGANLAGATMRIRVLPAEADDAWGGGRVAVGSLLLLAGAIVLVSTQRRRRAS